MIVVEGNCDMRHAILEYHSMPEFVFWLPVWKIIRQFVMVGVVANQSRFFFSTVNELVSK
jgi:hypothetical protein